MRGIFMEKLIATNNSLIQNNEIENKIYTIRGQQVMLDSDIAFLFRVDVKRLNQQMNRNRDRFPADFCFKLNSLEFKYLRLQNVTFNSSTKGRKYYPYVYTEHGIIALAGVLKSEVAGKMSVEIARAFIQMRKFILENGDMMLALAKLQNRQLEFENETNIKFDNILKRIEKLDIPKAALFFAGQWYDAYGFIVEIIKKAHNSIVIIDPYCDGKVLTYLANKTSGTDVLLIKSDKSKIGEDEIKIFKSQYGEITIRTFNDIHDRYLIIDNDECYSLGASLNYVGNKLFTISKIEDRDIINLIIDKCSSNYR